MIPRSAVQGVVLAVANRERGERLRDELVDVLDDAVEPGTEDRHVSIDAAVTNVNAKAELETVRDGAADH